MDAGHQNVNLRSAIDRLAAEEAEARLKRWQADPGRLLLADALAECRRRLEARAVTGEDPLPPDPRQLKIGG